MENWNWTENPKIDYKILSQLIFKSAMVTQCRKKKFQQMLLKQLDIHVKKMNLDKDLTLWQKLTKDESQTYV